MAVRDCSIMLSLFFVCGLVDAHNRILPTIVTPTNSGGPGLFHTKMFGPEYRCGDDHCWCDDSSANCARSDLTYIPKLPDSVTELSFAGNNIRSEMLTSNYFANASQVSYLDLSYNSLTYFPRDVFKTIQNLTILLVDNNPIRNYSKIAGLLSIPSLRKLTAEKCGLGHLPQTIFSKVYSGVQTLSLAHNKIYQADIGAFSSLKSLEVIQLTSGKISRVSVGLPLNVKELQLSDNNLNEFPPTCQNGTSLFPRLELLVLETNSISSVPKQLCVPRLNVLYLTGNSISRIFYATFSDGNFPSLTELYLNSQRSLFVVTDDAFSNTQLTTLNLDDNNLQFRGGLHEVDPYSFAGCPNLSTLSLSGNNFEGVDDEQMQKLLIDLPLTILTLENSHISQIYPRAFAQLSALGELYLSSNKIESIPDGAFDSLHNLTVLDISSNKISILTENTFSESTRSRFVSLQLWDNPYFCSCDLLWFKSWLVSNYSLFHEFYLFYPPEYKCSNIPDMLVANFTMVSQACLLSRETSVLITVTFTLTIFALAFMSLLFRYRWHLRLILYEAFRGRNNVRLQHIMAGNFTYDVFVSYASEDLPWVREHLMPELEDRLGLRLCVHERDFIPGNNIVDNIANCVQSSKKIMMVFSRDFVKSQWCQFELNFCLRHAMDHDDVLIIVCVDDVVSREMTTAMLAVLKTTTFIQWDELDDAIHAFWGRVHLSLNEIMDQRHL